MKAFEQFKVRQREKLIENFPASLPEEMRSLTREEFIKALRMSDWADKVPEAELTPEIVALGRMQREATKQSYEAFVKMGQILLELSRRFPVKTEFWQHVEEKLHWNNREDAELAMQAAAEAN